MLYTISCFDGYSQQVQENTQSYHHWHGERNSGTVEEQESKTDALVATYTLLVFNYEWYAWWAWVMCIPLIL